MANKNTIIKRRVNEKEAKTKGKNVVSQNVKRNMEMVITGGNTVHRAINSSLPSKPYKRTFKKNHAHEE